MSSGSFLMVYILGDDFRSFFLLKDTFGGRILIISGNVSFMEQICIY